MLMGTEAMTFYKIDISFLVLSDSTEASTVSYPRAELGSKAAELLAEVFVERFLYNYKFLQPSKVFLNLEGFFKKTSI